MEFNNKKYIDDYFKNNTKRLLKYFNKFSKPKEKDKFPEMLSELYLHIIENSDKLTECFKKDELHFYAIKYIYNQRNWNNTSFKKQIINIENNSELLIEIENNDYEDTFELLEEYLKDQIDFDIKNNKLKLALINFDLHEKILFNKYFSQNQSMREIGADVGLSHVAIFYIIKNIKNKIKNTKID